MTTLLSRLVWLIPVLLLLLSVVSGQDNPDPGPSSATTSGNYRWFCDLTVNPVVTLEWDSNVKGYVVQKPRPTDYYGLNNNNDGTHKPTIDSSNNNNYNDLNENGGGVSEIEEGNIDNNDAIHNKPWTRRLWEVVTSVFDDDDEENGDLIFIAPPNLRSPALLPEWNHNVPALAVLNNSSSTTSRNLRQQEPQPTAVQFEPQQGDNNNSLFALDFMTGSTVHARACDCWTSMVWGGSFYCPAPRTHCAIPSSPFGLPGCVDVQKQRRIVRSIWPVLVVWYASVLFCLSFTITGRHAMGCCISMVFPGWNRHTADRILRNDPNQANQMLLRHYRIMRAQYERRLMRRLRRRARRDRQRARRRQQQAHNPNAHAAGNNIHENDNDSSDSDIMGDEAPFPNLWDLAIIPRPVNTLSDEPQPATLTLKTRIYKRKEKDAHHDNQRYNITTTKDTTSDHAAESKGEAAAEAVERASTFATEEEKEDNEKEDTSQVKPTDDNIADNESLDVSKATKDEASALATEEDLHADVDEIAEKDTVDGGVREEKDDVNDSEEENVAAAPVVEESLDNNEGGQEEDQADAAVKEEEEVTTSCITTSKATADDNDFKDTAPLPPPCCDHDQDFSEWDDDNTCTICYGPLEDGDRVGALPCGHEFHTDPCLKHWLTRRNVCPLCLTENIATPRYADGTLAPLTSTTNEEENGNNDEAEGEGAMPPVILNFDDSSTSDQDLSSSSDGDGDGNSSGILDDHDPNRIPAFAYTPTTEQRPRRRPRMIELTSLFRRRRRQDNEDTNSPSPPAEQAP